MIGGYYANDSVVDGNQTLLGENAKGDVLDLCTGTLDLTEMLVAGGAQSVVALDFSAEMATMGFSSVSPAHKGKRGSNPDAHMTNGNRVSTTRDGL